MIGLKKIAFLLFLFTCTVGQAQIRYGFKTGLNFAKVTGPSEEDAAGAQLESWKNVIGFHIGVSFSNKFTDNFGVRGELLYSKRGGEYKFEGPGYRFFNYDGGSSFATGRTTYQVNINNSYIDLPVMAFYKAGDFEFSGGLYAGLMVQSAGEGSILFADGLTEASNSVDDTEFFLTYNYRKDKPGESVGDEKLLLRVDGRNLELPKTLGAYYDYPEDKGNLFNNVDFGVVGGISYFLTSALYVGARLQYGLSDVTNNEADLQKSAVGDNKTLIFRDDKDKNFAIQASVGFSF